MGKTHTHEEIEAVIKLWDSGLSASECIEAMNADPYFASFTKTRNSVVGIVSRNRYLSKRAYDAQPIKKKPYKGNRALAHRNPRGAGKAKSPDILPEPEPVLEVHAAPFKQRVPLIDVAPQGCRYPEAEDENGKHLFCNLPRLTGASYCPIHFRMVGGVGLPKNLKDAEVKDPDAELMDES